MKHKSWIKNYEHQFEQLAEELGDLRYDSLAEFLELLAQKIERDGQNDLKRSRKKLAKSLQNAAIRLTESAKQIEIAWSISAPYMFPNDITTKIRTEFGGREEPKQALSLLLDFYRNWEDDVHFRLARCLLFETNGNIQKLKENIQLAHTDWRDLIVQAEYDQTMRRLRNFNRPFGNEAITQDDLENDKFVSSNDDGLPF